MTATLDPTTRTIPTDDPTIYAEVPAELLEPQPLRVTGYSSRRADKGAELAHEARAFIKRFFHLPTDAATDAFVLWGVATNLLDAHNRLTLETFPLMFLGSDEPGSGKSTGVEMMENVLAGRGKRVAMPTAPAVLGYIQRNQHAILMDEADTLMGTSGGSDKLRCVMLESYTEGGVMPVGNRSAPGGVDEVNVHVPFLYAGLRQVIMSHPKLEALRTRTIVLPLSKPPAGVEVEPFKRRRDLPQAEMIRAALVRWGKRNAGKVAEIEPPLPEGVKYRDAQLWEPLIATAYVLGGDWPERALRACRELSQNEPGDNDDDDQPQTPLGFLLRDMAQVFADHGNPARLASRTIVHGLLELPRSPWRRWLDNDPQNVAVTGGKAIRDTLAARGVAPGVMKVDGMPVRGYERHELVSAGMPELPATNEDDDVAW